MKPEDLAAIRSRARTNHEKWVELKDRLQRELEEKCMELGGHDWWEWVEDVQYSMVGTVFYTHHRDCRACRRREFKTMLEGEG